jgi:hypothetical protein
LRLQELRRASWKEQKGGAEDGGQLAGSTLEIAGAV